MSFSRSSFHSQNHVPEHRQFCFLHSVSFSTPETLPAPPASHYFQTRKWKNTCFTSTGAFQPYSSYLCETAVQNPKLEGYRKTATITCLQTGEIFSYDAKFRKTSHAHSTMYEVWYLMSRSRERMLLLSQTSQIFLMTASVMLAFCALHPIAMETLAIAIFISMSSSKFSPILFS